RRGDPLQGIRRDRAQGWSGDRRLHRRRRRAQTARRTYLETEQRPRCLLLGSVDDRAILRAYVLPGKARSFSGPHRWLALRYMPSRLMPCLRSEGTVMERLAGTSYVVVLLWCLTGAAAEPPSVEQLASED